MFERARIAAASLRDDFHTHVARYSNEMRVRMVWEQQITGDLHSALDEKQIVPYLQPLVNAEGQVVGAEALVRCIEMKKSIDDVEMVDITKI
mgnify:CR=1 FL=1